MSGAFAASGSSRSGSALRAVPRRASLPRRGATVRVTEQRDAADGADELIELGVDVRLGGHDPAHLEGVDAVVTSPGVPERATLGGGAVERAIPIWSELDVGARLCTSRMWRSPVPTGSPPRPSSSP